MRLVVDASVAVKWAVAEDDHDLAIALISPKHELIAPDFLLLEVSNALWKKVRRKEITAEQARAGFEGTRILLNEIVPSQPYFSRALSLALDLDHAVYDCLYLAVAEAEGAKIVSADRRFLGRLAGGAYSDLVITLSEGAGA